MTSYQDNRDRRGIFIPLWIIEECDRDLVVAHVLAQVCWWHQPGLDGRPRVKYNRDGHRWLLRSDDEWEAEIMQSAKQVRRAKRVLVERGLVEVRRFFHKGGRVTAWRPTIDEAETDPEPEVEADPKAEVEGQVKVETSRTPDPGYPQPEPVEPHRAVTSDDPEGRTPHGCLPAGDRAPCGCLRRTPCGCLHKEEDFGGLITQRTTSLPGDASLSPGTAEPTQPALVDDPQPTALEPVPSDRPDVEECCRHLADRVAAHSPSGARPKVTERWRRDMRLLIDRGWLRDENAKPVPAGKVIASIDALFDQLAEPTRSGFCWADQVRSPAALRDHWVQIADEFGRSQRRPRTAREQRIASVPGGVERFAEALGLTQPQDQHPSRYSPALEASGRLTVIDGGGVR